jgi:hypothetical protein
MYEKLDQNDSLVSWMIAGGARLDGRDARHIGHLVALRDARRESARSLSPLARLTAWFGFRPSVTAAASSAAIVTSGTSTSNCCAPA